MSGGVLSCFVIYYLVLSLCFPFYSFPSAGLIRFFPSFYPSLSPSLSHSLALSSLYRSVPAPSCSYSPNQSFSLPTPVPDPFP